MISSVISEYGLPWVINRSLYSAKLKVLRTVPFTEQLFEKKVNVKRVDIFDVNIEEIEKFLIDLSEDKKREIIKVADNAIEGKIKAFSSFDLDYGSPINWHYDPITKKEVDKSVKWYSIPDFDAKRGDIKTIWEASRFTHLFYFVRAYIITKDKKYYNAYSLQLKSWIDSNTYSYGSNYKCGQEATLRMLNVLITSSVFKLYGFENKSDEENLFKLVEDSYKKVLSNFFYAHKCIKNNHTLSEITTLIVGAWCSSNKKMLKKAYSLLDKEIESQFSSDGGYVQCSFNYQRFALQIMEFVLKISEKTNLDISNKSKDILKNSVLLMYQMQDDTGDVPNYGSNDGALIFPVTSCDYRDFRPVINTVYVLLEGKRLFYNGDYDEELLWFCKKSIENIPYINIKRISSEFKEAGFYSLRHEDGYLMTVLNDYKVRPAQMDQQHIDIWHKGKNILCDSGTYSYAKELGKQMALTGAHNTVKVDDKDQMKKHGPFLIYDWTSASSIKHSQNCFTGTMSSQNDYTHTRTIEYIENSYLIQDHISGNINKCEFNFHTPCEIEFIENGIELIDDGITIARILSKEVIEVKKAYRSLYYLRVEEINKFSISPIIEIENCNINIEIQLL